VADNRLRVIVLGFLIREPTGGQAWHYLNYVHGLARLGHDVYYIEDSDDHPMCFDPSLSRATADASYGLRFAAAAFDRLGLSDRWAYYDAPNKEWRGSRASDARSLCETADLVLNVSGVNPLRDWLAKIPARAIIDTDPGITQIRNLADPLNRARCAAHTAFFSFGENIGNPFCSVPADGFSWRATRQPVSLDAWFGAPGQCEGKYTTVMQWDSFSEPYEFGELRFAMKSASFRPFMPLPSQVGGIFELAVRAPSHVISVLRAAGWGIADIDAVGADPWSYQAFIAASKAEFGIAKEGYAVTRCGWFSERSAGYLASGRPVLHQDTGFPAWLPCGRGVIPFRSPEDVVAAILDLDENYDAHCRAARELAVEYFAARRVLPPLIEAAMATG
jgi:hypothetical protein